MIGGDVEGSGRSNNVWEGTLESKNKITWEPMSPMQKKRYRHFSIVVDDNIYVFGGNDIDNDVVEVYDGREWKLGPEFSFSLSTENAQAVVDRKKRIIVTTNNYGIVIYDPIQGTITSHENHKLREERKWGYVALLQ